MSAVVNIELIGRTSSGSRYRVWHDGQVLIQSCREPLCDAARKLVEKGVTGRLDMCGMDGAVRLSGLIAVLATRTVTEGQDTSPRFAKWSPHWASVA